MTDEADASERIEVQVARTRALEPDFLDLTVDEARLLAEQHGLQLRVIDVDNMALTSDLRTNRMTVDVRTGRVSDATAG